MTTANPPAKCEKLIFLLADDDEDDYVLFRDALAECCAKSAELHRVRDGEELLDYLLHRGKCRNPEESPWPHLILLDLNMPRKNGREALREIKTHPSLNYIPVIAIAQVQEDVHFCYRLGASSVIKKPSSVDEFTALMKAIHEYWFKAVLLPKY